MITIGVLVIYQSKDCVTFDPIKPAEVPDWVKDPDILGRMVDGEAVSNDQENWYIARGVDGEQLDEPAVERGVAQ